MMKVKNLVFVAVAAVSVASGAHAAIDLGTTGNGELFLAAWDPVAKVSYTRDLGYNMDDFLPANVSSLAQQGTTLNSATDANWANFISRVNPAEVRWNIGALDSTGSGLNGERYLTTVTLGQESLVPALRNGAVTSWDLADGLPQSVNAFGTHLTQADGSAVNISDDGTAYAGLLSSWAHNWGTKSNFSTDAAPGESLAFFYITPSNTRSVSFASNTQYGYDQAGVFKAASWTLDANGGLSFKVPPAVPVPAAVWLLGSALVGLVGVVRRRAAV